MTFGSWAYHGNELDLHFNDDFERMDLTDLEKENTEWEVLNKGNILKPTLFILKLGQAFIEISSISF